MRSLVKWRTNISWMSFALDDAGQVGHDGSCSRPKILRFRLAALRRWHAPPLSPCTLGGLLD